MAKTVERRASDGIVSFTLVLISLIVVSAVFAIYAWILTHGTPEVEGVVLGRILGTLDTALGLVLGYWLGASFSDKGKDAALQSMARVNGSKTDDVQMDVQGDVSIERKKK